jgi:branched-chain amino acid transport system substrate-binding protein
MSLPQLLKSVIVLTLAGLSPQVSYTIQQTKEQIKIGLLIPNNKSLAAKQGAELAIRNANQKAGSNGKHFSLEVKSLEGPWGTGSKQAVSLIFDDNVCAIVGSCDGRNAHLIEQVCTKSRIVFLSAWSGDPSLSKAFVPWFFNCVPNDNQQSDALLEEIYNKRKLRKVAVISDNTYDPLLASDSFIKRSLQTGKPEPLKLSFKSDTVDFKNIVDQIKSSGTEALILTGNIKNSARLTEKLKAVKITIPVFGSLALLDEDISTENEFRNVSFISFEDVRGSEMPAFRKEYQKTYGIYPGAVAEYAYDGMNMLIKAISSSGTDRERIQKALLNLKFEGVTGTIKFDGKGNRMGSPSSVQIKNGLPLPVEKY